ncbi:MAG: putative tail fiber protein [Prokaryotic dsDNA virus sp.]|nr:MAG: putative tail fiber protein [Prokaryotic dsDNA virus sp.]|tara:strand:+ start:1929 stop:2330 length:402 start_codon:yes stop_codon:yes gene_type:complete
MVTRLKSTATAFQGQLAPIGCIMAYAGASAPAGWVFCDGAALSRTAYATLFGQLSTSFGAGDGSTTFNVPDIRGRIMVGKDDMGSGAASRVTTASDGLDGGTLAAAGAKVVETDAGKSQGVVVHYIIRAKGSD